MTTFAKTASLLALLATLVPSVLYFLDLLDQSLVKHLALGGTLVWFAVTPLWMGREMNSKVAS